MALRFKPEQPADPPADGPRFRTVRAAIVKEVRADGMTEEEFKVLRYLADAARVDQALPPLAIIAARFQHSTGWAAKIVLALETMGKIRAAGVGRAKQIEIVGTGLRTAPFSYVWKGAPDGR